MCTMKKNLLLIWLFLSGLSYQTFAQDRTVTGKVTSAEDSSPLPGVSVVVKGSTNGTATDAEGAYSISAPDGATLVFSFIGLLSQEVAVGAQSVVNVQLRADVTQLSEVVVTAVGIQREKRALGYATQEVKGERVSRQATNDPFQSLQGKVAGLNITQTSGAPGAGSTILIRGVNSLTGNNRNSPLIVVDGLPIDNDVIGTDAGTSSATVFGTGSFGNRGGDINPEDIESVNVLKGASAAAIYGIRGANGAIVITTKRGSKNKKISATVTSSFTLSTVNLLPKYQNEYGQGTFGRFSTVNSSSSWGRKFGTIANDSITDHNNNRVPYIAYPNNVRDFYNDGYLFTNNIQLAGGSEQSSFSLSIGRTDQEGIIPQSKLERTNLRLGGSTVLANKVTLDGNFTFINTQTVGSPSGNNGSSVFFLLPSIPRSYDLMGRPFQKDDGTQDFYSTNDNPRWSAVNSPATSRVNRFIGTFGIGYDILDWLKVKYSLGIDYYNDDRREVYGRGSRRFTTGLITADNISYQSIESNLVLSANKDLSEDISLGINLGHNVNDARRDRLILTGSGIATAGTTNVLNTGTVTVDTRNGVVSNRRLIGYFADATLGFRDYLFLNLVGRNDRSSTLPKENRSFFYGSTSLSLVFTEAFKIQSDVLSFGKIRASYAQVGNDAPPFSTRTTYNIPSYGNNVANIAFPFGGVAAFTLSDLQGNNTLKPETTREYEFGTELRFMKDRLSLDVTYYDRRTDDQILVLTVPSSTGFQQYTANAGTLTNKGIEATLNATVLKNTNFSWDVTVNFARNRNKVVSLAEGLENTQLGGFTGFGSYAVVGEPVGVFLGGSYLRDTLTNQLMVINSGPTRGTLLPGPETRITGNPNPDWTGSLINNFVYKGIRFGFQVDMQKGGDVLSNTIAFATTAGATEVTGVDREKPRIINGVQADPGGNLVLDGEKRRIPNNIQITSQAYWSTIGASFAEFSVFDGSYIRLRQITLGYSLPQSLLKSTPFGNVELAFSARNLLTYAPNLKNYIDPEAANAPGALIRGLEFNSGPGVANYGLDLRLTF
jgi:TonB-linked SusC/RagA family outer membrane protein